MEHCLIMCEPLILGVISAHSLIRDLLSKALIERGHRVTEIEVPPIEEGAFSQVNALVDRCDIVIVCTWGLPRGGCHVIRHLCTVDPTRRLVALDVAATAHEIDAALRAGAIAVVGSHSDLDDTLDAIDHVARGDSRIDEVRAAPSDIAHAPMRPLPTRRETEILQLIIDGFDIRTISEKLYISSKTVRHHLSSLYRCLEVSNRTDAVVRALRLGIVDLEIRSSMKGQDSSAGDSSAATSTAAASTAPSGSCPPSL